MVKKRPASQAFEFRLNDELLERMEIIRDYEKQKRGIDTMTNAVRAAIYYYSDKIKAGQV